MSSEGNNYCLVCVIQSCLKHYGRFLALIWTHFPYICTNRVLYKNDSLERLLVQEYNSCPSAGIFSHHSGIAGGNEKVILPLRLRRSGRKTFLSLLLALVMEEYSCTRTRILFLHAQPFKKVSFYNLAPQWSGVHLVSKRAEYTRIQLDGYTS